MRYMLSIEDFVDEEKGLLNQSRVETVPVFECVGDRVYRSYYRKNDSFNDCDLDFDCWGIL